MGCRRRSRAAWAIAILSVVTNASSQVTYLNGIVMPDDDQDSSSDEDEASSDESPEA